MASLLVSCQARTARSEGLFVLLDGSSSADVASALCPARPTWGGRRGWSEGSFVLVSDARPSCVRLAGRREPEGLSGLCDRAPARIRRQGIQLSSEPDRLRRAGP